MLQKKLLLLLFSVNWSMDAQKKSISIKQMIKMSQILNEAYERGRVDILGKMWLSVTLISSLMEVGFYCSLLMEKKTALF